jgi:hypothetical protein
MQCLGPKAGDVEKRLAKGIEHDMCRLVWPLPIVLIGVPADRCREARRPTHGKLTSPTPGRRWQGRSCSWPQCCTQAQAGWVADGREMEECVFVCGFVCVFVCLCVCDVLCVIVCLVVLTSGPGIWRGQGSWRGRRKLPVERCWTRCPGATATKATEGVVTASWCVQGWPAGGHIQS